MATLSLSPAQYKLGSMATKRIPLGNNPNAANSPFRGVALKRSQDQVEAQEDFPWDQQPNVKRQAFEIEKPIKRTSPRKHALPSAEGRVFNNKRPPGTPPTPFERQLLAVKYDKPQQRVERQEKHPQQSVKGIKQWQEHYKRAFPSFVFYFENIQEDVRSKCSKYARSFGAREEKFFSKDVTHVITLRDIPIDTDVGNSVDIMAPSSNSTSSHTSTKPRTINPSLLDQPSEHYAQSFASKGKFTFESGTPRRAPLSGIREIEQRRGNSGNTDILLKAKEMGMKVWQLEKFQRMIKSMLETPTESLPQQTNRTKTVAVAARDHREPELSRMLRNERLNGPSDRDSTVALNETISFKGPYIYIRDIDERTKPIMVRDYAKPSKDQMGDWPQFQGVGIGRCPFIPEVSKEDIEKVKAREAEAQAQKAQASRSVPVTRSAVQREDAHAVAAIGRPRRAPLQETKNVGNVPQLPQPSPQKAAIREFCPPPPIVANKTPSSVQVQQAAQAQAHPPQRLFGGEPAASGLQQSNITSAIRSQMISSTAAAPGAKAGTSKEVHGLKRKVLEKNTAPVPINIQSRHTGQDQSAITRAEKAIPAARQTRQQVQHKVQQKPALQDDDSTQSEGEDVWLAEGVKKTGGTNKKASEGKEATQGQKPGYCENCREKYDDFDDHVIGRKHRKFALTKENWKGLDWLLAHLGRRLKEPESDSF